MQKKIGVMEEPALDLNLSVMDELEKIGFLLREQYQKHGFSRYRMSKFEEYDLYSRNKDFLLSDSVITFMDPSGRLLALKPDVTLSIVKNIRDCGEDIRKLYYHENVYRVLAGTDEFREETQVGVECMGRVDYTTLSEIIMLALTSLQILNINCILEISHLDILGAAVDSVSTDISIRNRILECVEHKNAHGIREICVSEGLNTSSAEPLLHLMSLDGSPGKVLTDVRNIAREIGCEKYADSLEKILDPLMNSSYENHLLIDFSTTGDLKYYNGLVMKGFIEGIPDPVLSGGQYDKLMHRMGRKDRAVGFAVFLNRLERMNQEGGWLG